MTIEAVPLDHCRRHNHLKTFRWIDASQDAWAAGGGGAGATGYSVASPLAANEMIYTPRQGRVVEWLRQVGWRRGVNLVLHNGLRCKGWSSGGSAKGSKNGWALAPDGWLRALFKWTRGARVVLKLSTAGVGK